MTASVVWRFCLALGLMVAAGRAASVYAGDLPREGDVLPAFSLVSPQSPEIARYWVFLMWLRFPLAMWRHHASSSR
jgi:hypothetical protein